MNHISRFKIVYVQIIVALASSIGGELVGMKDLTKAELADLTWIAWTLCLCNILANLGNTIIALFNPPPPAKNSTTTTSTSSPTSSEIKTTTSA
jgi:hypothetical protein